MKKNDYYLYLIIFLIILFSVYLFYSNYSIKNINEKFQTQPNFYRKTIILPRREVELESAQLSAVRLPTSYNILTANRITIGVYDQFLTYTCVACTISFALTFHLRKNRISTTERPSRVFLYQLSKWKQNYPTFTYSDLVYWSGIDPRFREAYSCHIVGGNFSVSLSSMDIYKIPSESAFPFPTEAETYAANGDTGALCRIIPSNFISGRNIRNNRTLRWETIRSPKVQNIKQHLLSNHPVIIGIQLWSSFLNADGPLSNSSNFYGGARIGSGHFRLPNTRVERYFGDHAVTIIAYNDSTSNFTFRNSWGMNYGNHTGNYTIPYSYITGGSREYGAFTSDHIAITNYS